MRTVRSRQRRQLPRRLAIAGVALLTALWTPAIARAALTTDSPATVNAEISQVPQQFGEAQFCAEDLPRAIDAVVGRPQFNTANWGIVVYPVNDGRTLYSRNANTMLIPASNTKLFTTAATIRILLERAPDALWEMTDDLNLVNRNSNNARADDLLRRIGGQYQVQAALEPLGVSPDGYVQADGSGLSRANRAQPATLVSLLKGMHEADSSGLFYSSLPVGGVNGTLRNRFQGTAAQGKLHAKTGTLRGVRALSGYLETDDYGTVIFSVLVNQSGQSGRVMLDAIDELVLLMAKLEACG